MIKVLLADDHQMFIDGMCALLEKEENIQVVGESVDGIQVLDLMKKQEVDVVVMDIEMPNLNGVEATKIIRKDYPKTKVLILTMYNKKDFIVNLMKYGASGYILKNKTESELINAIHNVHNGKTHYSLDVLDTAISVNEHHDDQGTLTEREEQVLIKMAEGYKSREISKLLYISEATVNTHRRNILSKLNLTNTAQVVRYAIRKGYIEA